MSAGRGVRSTADEATARGIANRPGSRVCVQAPPSRMSGRALKAFPLFGRGCQGCAASMPRHLPLFLAQVSELRERAQELPDELFVCLVGDMITEEALPT